MSIFSKPLSVAVLTEKIAIFDDGTKALEQRRDNLSRKLSAALARQAGGEPAGDARKLKSELAEIEGELDARPLALQALQREFRRAERAEKIRMGRQQVSGINAWVRELTKAGERLSAISNDFGKALTTWREVVVRRPLGAGPIPTTINRNSFLGSLDLEPLEKILPEVIAGKKNPQAAGEAIHRLLDTISRYASVVAEENLQKIEMAEKTDPEVCEVAIEV